VKRIIWLLTTVLVITAVSCGPSSEVETPIPNEDNGGGLNPAPEDDSGIFPRATLTPPPISDPSQPESAPDSQDGYPAPPVQTLPEGYAVPTGLPVLNPYPEAIGSLIWVLKPVGEQCAEAPATPDLQTAVADMIAFGIPVEASEMTDLIVCMACGCPTSAHFRLQIDAGYLGNAEVLGWVAEE
jgi:hypothetical protein